jgi:glycerate kinase
MGRVVSLIFDSFKGSIGAAEIGGIVREKLSPSLPTIELVNVPASDGGDGFVDAFAHHTGGELVECDVGDPLGRRRTARYIWSGTAQACP